MMLQNQERIVEAKALGRANTKEGQGHLVLEVEQVHFIFSSRAVALMITIANFSVSEHCRRQPVGILRKRRQS